MTSTTYWSSVIYTWSDWIPGPSNLCPLNEPRDSPCNTWPLPPTDLVWSTPGVNPWTKQPLPPGGTKGVSLQHMTSSVLPSKPVWCVSSPTLLSKNQELQATTASVKHYYSGSWAGAIVIIVLPQYTIWNTLLWLWARTNHTFEIPWLVNQPPNPMDLPLEGKQRHMKLEIHSR